MPPHINAPLIHDRGEARVFRGRDAIRAQFGLLLEAVAADPTLGSCMLFQGPPGIGKTALLLELAKQGSKSSWRVFHIEAAALGSPAQMAKALNWSHLHKRRKFAQAALGGIGGTVLREFSGETTPMDVLSGFVSRKRKPTLLVLDEAQGVASPSHSANAANIEGSLYALINGRLAKPAVLIAGGLSHSSDAFETMLASRLPANMVIDLDVLDRQATLEIIEHWVPNKALLEQYLAGGYDTIADHSHRWPQHIVLLCASVSHFLARVQSNIEIPVTESPLDYGLQAMQDFYKRRCAGLHPTAIALLGCLVSCGQTGQVWDEMVLTNLFRALEAVGGPNADGFMADLVRKGVLMMCDGGRKVPIPSMETYLTKRFEKYRLMHPDLSRLLQQIVTQSQQPEVSRDSGMGR